MQQPLLHLDDNMNFEKIQSKYKGSFLLEYESSVHSTNSVLKNNCAKLSGGTVLFARNQTAGRGRTGKSFYSYDGGVYMSILLKTGVPCENALDYTTAAAVAVCRALEKTGSGETRIKWVNDVYYNGKKVCGILTEAVTDTAKAEVSVIVGIGVNLFAPESFPADIESRAGFVFECKDENTEEKFIINLLCELENLFSGIKNGMRAHVAEYIGRSFIAGKTVTLIKNGERRRAFVKRITDTCALEIEYQNGENALIFSGEISIEA